jgi:peptidoglycan hydrolase-like protein with peptidoglycan-binding domain
VPPIVPAIAVVPATAPAAARPTIKQGSSGPDVVLWQKVIGVATDGKFGPGTTAATKTWQTKRGLPADGIVGPKTWAAALGSGAAVSGAVPSYVVQPNDTPFTIARRFTGDGSRMFELAEANPETAPNIRNGIVFQGQALNLPNDWHVGYEPALDDSALAGVLDIIGASHGRPTHSDHWRG